ncbi:universal stress protein [Actinoplanes teichomyceticus]|uniref:Nucleotide-binding universal stress UspA family protein n=1 Tax=Actinoplanes teichomyceticus TaxID=1867 RepID=A0A561VC91_ACTTI|nr:universal stress protein [Actinoplanes teichomyceticus]TWG09241.1 nucleotide-binding universal stress UspA family protein [Actinoplanes teichomyceticus]GIF17116.1 universal stress protein [Actinoplanes teichomyceticus]
MQTPTIMVATDGAATGEATIRWAAAEAGRRHCRLSVVHVLDWDWTMARYDIQGAQFEAARRLAEEVTAGAVAQARAAVPELDIVASTPVGDPVTRLLDAAEGAQLLVLGTRGRGGFTGLLLGSVSQRLATHAACPVVVVRGHAGATEGPVAAGIDDSPAAEHVLAAAFAAAASRGARLVVVRSYLPAVPLYYLRDAAPELVETPEQDAAERIRLHEQLAPWRERYPDVPVETLLSHGGAAGLLVGVSRGAQLVVVGSRGHGVLAGSLLGSTGLQLLQHAECPVQIVRRSGDQQRGHAPAHRERRAPRDRAADPR